MTDASVTAATGQDAPESEDGTTDEQLVRILTLLAQGRTDAAVARHLHIGQRTVERRIAALMARHGINSRIQLGVLAARLGWIENHPTPQLETLPLPRPDGTV